MQKSAPVTVLDYINHSASLLTEKGIIDARLNAELMLCEVLNYDRTNLYLNFDKPLSTQEKNVFREMLLRRLRREPLQYILGKTSFYGLDIAVDKSVMIPRQETEQLTERILEDIKLSCSRKVSIFEIGTGSGCISIALAKNLEDMKTDYDIFSIDISKEAIETANKNLKLNNITEGRIQFFQKDVFEIEALKRNFDYMISNPPYVSLEEYKGLEPEVKNHEPDIALTDFGEGLKFYERIFLIASAAGFRGKIFCEIGFGQRQKLELLLKKSNLPEHDFYKDYNGTDRILEIRK